MTINILEQEENSYDYKRPTCGAPSGFQYQKDKKSPYNDIIDISYTVTPLEPIIISDNIDTYSYSK